MLAVDTETARQTFYRFTLTVRATTVVNRLDLNFTASANSGLQDASGLFTGFTTRLAGTGTVLPALDPNLTLNATSGVLELSTTQADFFGGAGLANASCPGISLAQLGLTGAEDFSITTVLKPLPALELRQEALVDPDVPVGISADPIGPSTTLVSSLLPLLPPVQSFRLEADAP